MCNKHDASKRGARFLIADLLLLASIWCKEGEIYRLHSQTDLSLNPNSATNYLCNLQQVT